MFPRRSAIRDHRHGPGVLPVDSERQVVLAGHAQAREAGLREIALAARRARSAAFRASRPPPPWKTRCLCFVTVPSTARLTSAALPPAVSIRHSCRSGKCSTVSGSRENGTEKISLPPGASSAARVFERLDHRRRHVLEHVAGDDEILAAVAREVGAGDVEPRRGCAGRCSRRRTGRRARPHSIEHVRQARCRGTVSPAPCPAAPAGGRRFADDEARHRPNPHAGGAAPAGRSLAVQRREGGRARVSADVAAKFERLRVE